MKLTEAQVQKRYAEGRGSGELADYKPFIDHHDVSSLGLASRVPSVKTGRIHHFLSNVETDAFRELVRMPQVLDIREQYPLDREDTRRIAAEMGVPHPVYRPGVDMVMTTDLLVIVASGGEQVRFARAGKTIADLADPRTMEKLEIERRYWTSRGVHWSLVTDLDRSARRATTLAELMGMEALPEEDQPSYWTDRIAIFRTELAKARGSTFEDLDRRLARKGFQSGEMINVLRHLAWHGEIAFDLDQTFDIRWPVANVTMTRSGMRRAA